MRTLQPRHGANAASAGWRLEAGCLPVVLVIGWGTSPFYEPLVTEQQLVCQQISHEVECELAEEATVNKGSLNWIFWGTTGGIVLAWYILIRGYAIKKPVLGN